MSSQCEFHFDSELSQTEAKQKGAAADVSRLVLRAPVSILAEVVRIASGSTDLYAIGIGTSSKPPEGVDMFLSPQASGDVVRLHNAVDLSIIMERWPVEILALFSGDPATVGRFIQALPTQEPKWWHYSSGAYEVPFLKLLRMIDPLTFFAPSRSAIEIFGTFRRVYPCATHCAEIYLRNDRIASRA